jgi:hypothetical protein
MKDRAETEGQKEAVIDALYAAWLKRPHLRLGQLICNVTQPGPPVFYVEDFELVRRLRGLAGDLPADQPAATETGWLARGLKSAHDSLTPEQRERVRRHPSGFLSTESAQQTRERLGWPPLTEEQQAENLERNLADRPARGPVHDWLLKAATEAQTLPMLVRKGRAGGIPEQETRTVAQTLIETGELVLRRDMRVVAETARCERKGSGATGETAPQGAPAREPCLCCSDTLEAPSGNPCPLCLPEQSL